MTKKPPQDTSLGGEGAGFPETTGGILSVLGGPGPSTDRSNLEGLCRKYWKPVYVYIRIAWAKANEDAKDLTQAFFLWLIGGEALQRYDPRRGGFRAYLKVLLKRFVGHEERALKALKRGGDLRIVSLDGEAPALRPFAASADPGEAFEKVWFDQLVRGAVDRVRDRCAAGGKEIRFRLYEEFTQPPKPERPSYKELAARHGLKESDIENWLFSIREEIRAELRTGLAQVTASAQEFEDEWKRLFGR
ncbi:MAG TPA: sigma-70 family RNA polymerase sigma factor [Planctomycetota bacterium]|nr:sigma-70 family RNA polymerase sigma factor [Planctomycetota bacterium]